MGVNIPLDIKDKSPFSQLKKNDRLTIAYAVLFGVSNQEAYKIYHPEYLTADGKLNETGKQASTMFWNYGKTKDYRELYEKELTEFLGKKTAPKSDVDAEIDDTRKNKVLKELLSQAMSLVERGNLDPDTMKTVVEVFRKLNLLKDEAERVIPPLRFLPVRCKSECRYRLFVETAKANKHIYDDCDYCKARKFAEEHGFVYNPCTVLDLPEDVVAEIDSHNDVKLLDILDGEIEN